MITLQSFRKLALGFPSAEESVHFHLVVFGVRKRNFASFDPRTGELSLKLRPTGPDRLDGIQQGYLSVAPGKYGEHGWTTVDIEKIEPKEFGKLLTAAYAAVAAKPKKPTVKG